MRRASAPTSTASRLRIRFRVTDALPPRGLIDTSVVIDLERVAPDALPPEIAISAVSLAELAAGPHASDDPTERARRQERLQRVEATFDALPFDSVAARAYGRLYAEVASGGRKTRGKRALDLLIAATALAADLPLYTRNPSDFEGLGALVDVTPLRPAD
jgi:predicted nucleic acid-binding protein